MASFYKQRRKKHDQSIVLNLGRSIAVVGQVGGRTWRKRTTWRETSLTKTSSTYLLKEAGLALFWRFSQCFVDSKGILALVLESGRSNTYIPISIGGAFTFTCRMTRVGDLQVIHVHLQINGSYLKRCRTPEPKRKSALIVRAAVEVCFWDTQALSDRVDH